MQHVFTALPWQPISELDQLTEQDIVLLRVDDDGGPLELYRYYPAPKYRGLFKPINDTSLHYFFWPRNDEVFGSYYPVTHFLKLGRGFYNGTPFERNDALPWTKKHTRSEWSYNVVGDNEMLESKLYCRKPEARDPWHPVNGYGKTLLENWVDYSLVVMKPKKGK